MDSNTTRRRHDSAAWAALVGIPLAYELWQVSRHDDGVPLSVIIRTAFRTDTPEGALLFTLAVEATATWLTRHILNGTRSLRVSS